MKKSILMLALFAFAAFTVNAQRTTSIKDADYSFLKGETALNVVFDYEGMTIGENQTEVDFFKEKGTEKMRKRPVLAINGYWINHLSRLRCHFVTKPLILCHF